METYLGIDFGTTNTRIAVGRVGEAPIALPIGTGGKPFMPSVAALRRQAGGPPSIYQVGEPAAALSDSDDILIIENLKRCLMYRVLPKEDASLPHWWDRESGTIRAWGYSIDPVEVAAAIVASALRAAERAGSIYGFRLAEEGIRSIPTVVGCPAYSGYEVHCMVREIMRLAGIEQCGVGSVVEEPNLTAAAYAALRELRNRGDPALEQRRIVLIYDLGGGTFDTAVVEVRFVNGVPRLTVLGSASLPFVGGMDIDQALARQLQGRMAEAAGISLDEFVGGLLDWEWSSLLRRVREVKEELAIVPEPILTAELRGGQPLAISVTRKDLDEALKESKVIDKTLQCCLRAYRRARMYLHRHDPGGFYMGMTPEGRLGPSVTKIGFDDMARGVDDLILVGGSTASPNLRERLLRRLGEDKALAPEGYLDPITANCVGAAMPQERYASAVLTRSPYWVRLRCGDTISAVYRPFDAYLEYAFSLGIPFEKVLWQPVDLSDAGCASIIISDCGDGKVLKEDLFETRGADQGTFAFDRYGTIHVCSSPVVRSDDKRTAHHSCDERDVLFRDESPPWQHEYQREMFEALRDHERQKREREEEQLKKNLGEPDSSPG